MLLALLRSTTAALQDAVLHVDDRIHGQFGGVRGPCKEDVVVEDVDLEACGAAITPC